MNIYAPYTYLIGWSNHNKWYYGRRTAKGCNPIEFWNTYFTSSKHVKQFRENYGDPDIIEIRKVFITANQCKVWESKVLKRLNVAKDDRFLNIKNGDSQWDTTGFANAKCAKTLMKLGMISLTDERWRTGEIVGLSHNISHQVCQKAIDAMRKATTDPIKGKIRAEKISKALKGRKSPLIGRKQTQEHIDKRKLYGDKNPQWGVKHDDEYKINMSNATKGIKWWTNGIINVKSRFSPGDGWYNGRTF